MKRMRLIFMSMFCLLFPDFTLQAQQGGYCIPQYNYGTQGPNGNYTQNDFINSVILNGEVGYPVLNSNLNCCGPNIPPWNGGPAPFSAHPPDYESFPLSMGYYTVLQKCPGNFILQVQVGNRSANSYVAAWIDFNRDSLFDAGEKIMQTPGLGLPNLGWENSAFTVPSSVPYGLTTLRVRSVYNQPNIDPCNTEDYGETEDFPLVILPCCNLLPGWTLWVGAVNDDWDLDANWCGGVPNSNKNAAIIADVDPVSGIQPPLHQPVIKTDVVAFTKKLWIDGPSNLTIDAASNSALHVYDSLLINTFDSRINVTSPMEPYLIDVKSHWLNNGTFNAGKSRVTFNGTAIHFVFGDSVTKFNQLAVASQFNVKLFKPVIVSDTLFLTEGNLILNQRELTVLNNHPDAIQRMNGFLVSEDSLPPYGTVNWKIGNQNGNYVIPFANDSGHYIPFTYEKATGFSDLYVSTYRTSKMNTPWPQGVTNLNGLNSQTSNGQNMVDRFWIINESGTNVTAGLDFSFTASEASGCTVPFISQRWNGTVWELPLGGQTSGNYFNNTPSVQQTSGVWAITCNGQTLNSNENSILDDGMIHSAYYSEGELLVQASFKQPGKYHLSITDPVGRIILLQSVNISQIGGQVLKINCPLANGIYFICAQFEGGKASKKFVAAE